MKTLDRNALATACGGLDLSKSRQSTNVEDMRGMSFDPVPEYAPVPRERPKRRG